MSCKRIIGFIFVLMLFLQMSFSPVVSDNAGRSIISQSIGAMTVYTKGAIVSSENLSSELIKHLESSGYVILDSKQIRQKADQNGDFMYYRFKKMRLGIVRSTIEVDHIWVTGKNSKIGHLSGGGMQFNYYFFIGKSFRFERNTWIS